MTYDLGEKLGGIVYPGAGLMVRLDAGVQRNVLGSARGHIKQGLRFSLQSSLWDGLYWHLRNDLQRNQEAQ